MNRTVFEVVTRHGDGTFQLFGANGLVAHTDRDTIVEPGVQLQLGARVVADTEVRGTKNVARRVSLHQQMDPEARARMLLAAYRDAFIELDADPHQLAQQDDVGAALWRKLERSGPVYPRCLWNDPALQLADARALLSEYGISLGEVVISSRDTLEICRAIVAAADEALRGKGDERRFFEIHGCPHPDPIARWILATPHQLSVLRARGILGAEPGIAPAIPIARPSIARRVSAKLIDCIIAGITIYGFARRWDTMVGVIAGYVWLLTSDWSGSPGKWLLGLRAVDRRTKAPCTLVQSILRNLPFAFSALPGTLSFFALGIQIVELLRAANDPAGSRYGDLLAKTVVVARSSRES